MPKKSEYTITIDKIVSGGYGLGHLPDGMVVLVPLVLPGEEVRIRLFRRCKDYVEARLIEIIRPSSLRVDPVCPHYDRCGGCDFQHTDTKNQIRLKAEILKEQLLRAGAVLDEPHLSSIWSSPLSSPRAFGYRQRIRLQVDSGGLIGYFQFRSHSVEPIQTCSLARPEINTVLEQASQLASMDHLLDHCRAVEFFLSPDDGQVVLYLHFTRKPRPADRNAALAVQTNIATVKGVVLEVEGYGVIPVSAHKKGPETGSHLDICMTLPATAEGRELVLRCEPGGFYQVNQEANEQLVKTVRKWAAITGKDRVLDLFCGMGNFSLPLALQTSEVVGLDMQRAAIRNAVKNAASAGLSNCRFEKKAAKKGAADLVAAGESFNLVLLDPPRQGCSDVIPYLPRLGAERIVYVSCDPATLARDLAVLARSGYILSRIRVVDMFPQTHHMETVALLQKV